MIASRRAPDVASGRSTAPLVLWLDEPGDAPAQMARDVALLERAMADRQAGTVLRVYTFAPPGITLGRAQDPPRELNLESLARDGVAWAVRPTGGRAIWHDEEWTFALATRLDESGWALTPAQAYERTARLLAAAFLGLGVPATLSPGSPRGPGPPRAAQGAAPPCFASTARHELSLEGRKLGGIAQRVVRGALLQQGSLLLGDSHARLARYVPGVPEARRQLESTWREGAAPAGRHLGAARDPSRLVEALALELGLEAFLRDGEGASALGVPLMPRRSP